MNTPYPIITKPTIEEQDGVWVWVRRPSPEQDAKWLAREREDVRACVRYAKSQSKLAVQYRKWAAAETDPARAAHYTREADAYQSGAWWYLNHARSRNV